MAPKHNSSNNSNQYQPLVQSISRSTSAMDISSLRSLALLLCLVVICTATSMSQAVVEPISSISSIHQQANRRAAVDIGSKARDDSKSQFICSLSGGLDVVRLSSSTTRLAFKDALEDVEFIRQYIAESAMNNNNRNNKNSNNGNARTGFGMTLDELSQTLDYKARNISSTVTPSSNSTSTITTIIPELATTVTAGLGYTDDRVDRRIERYVGLTNEPLVGTKQTDLDLIEPTADILPWMVDRTANSMSEQQKADTEYDRLYVAAWIGTHGEAWMYYPSLQNTYGHPLAFGDVLGGSYDSKGEEFVKPNLPPAVIDKAYFTAPYPDTAIPGLSLITAQAPIYITGEFQGYSYNQTYIASTGLDISVASMATFLDDLAGTLTAGSFAVVVGVEDFHTILISQSTVDRLYPQYTGMEESRVTYREGDGSIVNDGRNKPYKVSDTIFQPPTNLTNSPDWNTLASNVQSLQPGLRSSTLMNITLTGDTEPTPFYVMYERWSEVADWALLLLVPQEELDTSVVVEMSEPVTGTDLHVKVSLDANGQMKPVAEDDGNDGVIETILRNTGVLDVTVSITKLPPWFQLLQSKSEYKIPAGGILTLTYAMVGDKIPKKTRFASSLIALTIKDDNYGNCFYEQVLTTNVLLRVNSEENLNQLDAIRPYGFTLSAIIVASAVGWSIWVFLHASHPVVKSAQPLFLHMMCTGILVMGLSIIPLGIDDSMASEDGCSIACMAFPWLMSIGFSIAYSALFSKVWRINQIVAGAKKYKRVDVSARDAMVPFVVICTVNVTILSIWSGVDPLTWVRESSDGESQESGESDDSHGRCSLSDSSFGLVCLILLLLVNFGALCLALIQLYRARELSTEYSEGKYIAIAMGSMIQVFLTGLPILVIVTDSPQVSYFVKSTIVFTVAMSLLLLIFVPKFYTASSKKNSNIGSISSGSRFGGSTKIPRPVPVSESDITSLPVGNAIVLPNGGMKNKGAALQTRRVTFSDDGDGDSDDDDDDSLMRNNSTFQMPTKASRAHTISDISMSQTPSECDTQSSCEPEASEDCHREQAVASKLPIRLPSVMEDDTEEEFRERTKLMVQECFAMNKVTPVAPTLPTRLPSFKESFTDSTAQNKSSGSGATDDIGAMGVTGANDCSELPLQRQETDYSNPNNASMPKRLPSAVEPNDTDDEDTYA